eukprot:597143-Pleurochrysis_carterae.AAC.2
MAQKAILSEVASVMDAIERMDPETEARADCRSVQTDGLLMAVLNQFCSMGKPRSVRERNAYLTYCMCACSLAEVRASIYAPWPSHQRLD